MARKKRTKKRTKELTLTYTLLVVAGIAAGLFIALGIQERLPAQVLPLPSAPPSTLPSQLNLSLEGFTVINITIEKPATVIMEAGCWQISALTTEPQAYSLELGLKNETGTRPMTHDLIRDIFQNLGIQVLQAKITHFEPEIGTYVGQLILKQGDKILVLDARPTDAIGIASRMAVPVYINQSLLELYGRKIC